jgi:hypothetical protein
MLSLINSRIRTKLYVAYAGAFLVIFLVSGVIIYSLVGSILRQAFSACSATYSPVR